MKKENNKKIGLVVGGAIVLIIVFYGGVVYGKSHVPIRGAGMETNAFRNGTFNANGARGGMGGFTTGQIISKDDKSITVSLTNGGSKIIFLDNTTKISKSTDGSMQDLTIGAQVSVTGAANSDGSLNATTVQIRPTSMVK